MLIVCCSKLSPSILTNAIKVCRNLPEHYESRCSRITQRRLFPTTVSESFLCLLLLPMPESLTHMLLFAHQMVAINQIRTTLPHIDHHHLLFIPSLNLLDLRHLLPKSEYNSP